MKKVLCVHEGRQVNEYRVKRGIVYTVLELIPDWYGQDCYRLVEMGDACVFATHLFIELPEMESVEVVEGLQKQDQ